MSNQEKNLIKPKQILKKSKKVKQHPMTNKNINKNKLTADELTLVIADMINSNKYTDDEINDVICGKNEPPNIDILNKNKKKIIDTNGIKPDDPVIKNMTTAAKLDVKQCSACGKIFSKELITKSDNICWHCYFWMNYDIKFRAVCDGPENVTIAEYILKCHEEHDETKCTKFSSYKECFLCDYKFKRPILCIKDEHLLKPKKEETNNKNDISDTILIRKSDTKKHTVVI